MANHILPAPAENMDQSPFVAQREPSHEQLPVESFDIRDERQNSSAD